MRIVSRIERRAAALVAVLAVLAVVATACGGNDDNGSAREADTVKYMSTPGVLTELPVEVAEKAGLFEKAGITLNSVTKPTSLPAVQGLKATGADVGTMATASLVQGRQAGNDVTMFCGGARYIDTTLMAGKGSTYPAASDGASPTQVLRALSGKKIGVIAPVGSALQLQIASSFEQFGATGVKYVLVGATPAIVQAALDHGDVDAVATLAPTTQLLEASKAARPLLFLPDVPGMSHDAYGGGYVASATWVAQHAETARKFCGVITQASEYMKDSAHSSLVKEVLASSLRVDASQAAYLYRTAVPAIDTSLPKNILEKTFDLYLQTGIAKKDPPLTYDELVTTP